MLKKTLLLNRPEIEKLIGMPEALGVVEEAFVAQAKGKILLPPKVYIPLLKYGGDFRAMPAYIEGMEACGIKWVNVYPKNKKFGLPTVMAVIILNDPKSGFPLAIMDGAYITNLRTGAAGGIAAKYLANKNSTRVSLIGCGNQAKTQLMALHRVFKIKSVSVYDIVRSNAIDFIKKMKLSGLKIKYASNIKECIDSAEILVTTTPSRKPIVKSEWIGDGVHINAIGADAKGKEELEPAILKRAKIIVDDKIQAMHNGEINVPVAKRIIKENDIYATLGEIITAKKNGRIAKDEITIFDSTGLAICDVAIASYVYKKAIRQRIGRYICLFL